MISKKFSIVEKLNTNELTNQIVAYENSTNCAPYIFVNKETLDQIKAAIYDELLRNCDDAIQLKLKYTNGLVGYYQGYKVFEDNTLGFGEVELR